MKEKVVKMDRYHGMHTALPRGGWIDVYGFKEPKGETESWFTIQISKATGKHDPSR